MARLVLSQNERLLLHLLELDRHRDDPEVPLAASQEGMAQKLDTGVHGVSRLLSLLEDEGLVSGHLAHVRGAPKRRKAYFLTEKGKNTALGIRSDISMRKVVVEHEGKAQEMTLEEAVRRIASVTGATPGFSEMVELARLSDTVRTESFPKPIPSKKCGPEFVERSHGRPRIDLFFGRESEKKALLEKLNDASTFSILLWGIPGIGKSTLASKLFEELSGKKPMFWYAFREWDTEASFLSSLSEFLEALGHSKTVDYLRRGASPAEMFVPLEDDFSGCGAIIFLDDVQKSSPQVTALLSVVMEAAKASRSSKTILLSRSIPQFYSKTDIGNASLELMGLDRDSSWHMAQRLNAKDSIRVVDESHGHPLLLSLMARSRPGKSQGDVSAFIEREVYSVISDQERSVLEALSVFRHPVRTEAIPDANLEVISKLRQRAMLMEQEDGVWTHDLLREFFSAHLDAEKKRLLHSLAGSYCERQPGVEWELESLYHLVEAGDWSNATRVATTNATDLGRDFPEETLGLISRIPLDKDAHKQNAELLFMRGQLHEDLGKQESAFADFEKSLSLLGKDEDAAKRALVLETLAKLQSEIQRWSDSLSGHEKALHLYEESGDREGQIREWINIGGVFRRKGEFSRARDSYSKALSIATRDENRQAQAACLNNLGLLDRDGGNLRDAEMRLKESIRLAHAVADDAGEARGLENLAELYRIELRSNEMISMFLQSSEAFRRAGEPEEFKRVQALCAEAMSEQGRTAEGIALAEAALQRQDLKKRRGLFQKAPRYDNGDVALSSALVELHRSSGDANRARRELARFASFAEALGSQELMARGKLMQAMIHEDLGESALAIKALGEAESILRPIGSSEGLIAVHMRRAAVHEKLGNLEAAAVDLAEAISQADRAGDEYARSLALARLSDLRNRSKAKSPA